MSNKNKNKLGVVYSTNPDFKYQHHGSNEKTLPNQQQQLRVRIEKNHRGGKTVTIVDGFVGKNRRLTVLRDCRQTAIGSNRSSGGDEKVDAWIARSTRKRAHEVPSPLHEPVADDC